MRSARACWGHGFRRNEFESAAEDWLTVLHARCTSALSSGFPVSQGKFRGAPQQYKIGTNETKPNPSPNTNPNPKIPNPTDPTKHYHLMVLFKKAVPVKVTVHSNGAPSICRHCRLAFVSHQKWQPRVIPLPSKTSIGTGSCTGNPYCIHSLPLLGTVRLLTSQLTELLMLAR